MMRPELLLIRPFPFNKRVSTSTHSAPSRAANDLLWNKRKVKRAPMIGAIAGDIIGSVYERHRIKTKDFPLFSQGCRFTDDSVLTVALADAILSGRNYD